jgi:hypothetical protein
MRLSHPYAWVLLVIGGAICGVFVAVVKLLRLWRAATWSKERERRARWTAAVVSVESWTRIGDAGLFRLVLRLPVVDSAPSYRTAATPHRFRGFTRLPDGAVEWLERGELPVRVPSSSPARMVIDLTPMVGEADDRKVFVEWGRTRWTPAS